MDCPLGGGIEESFELNCSLMAKIDKFQPIFVQSSNTCRVKNNFYKDAKKVAHALSFKILGSHKTICPYDDSSGDEDAIWITGKLKR